MSYSAEVDYLHRRGADPAIVRSGAEVDALIDDLLAQAPGHNLAALYVRERPHNERGFPDHELCVGVNATAGLGVLRYLGPSGHYVSRGDESLPDGAYPGDDRDLPPHSQVPLDVVRAAVKEFLDSGGERPSTPQWQAPR